MRCTHSSGGERQLHACGVQLYRGSRSGRFKIHQATRIEAANSIVQMLTSLLTIICYFVHFNEKLMYIYIFNSENGGFDAPWFLSRCTFGKTALGVFLEPSTQTLMAELSFQGFKWYQFVLG